MALEKEKILENGLSGNSWIYFKHTNRNDNSWKN